MAGCYGEDDDRPRSRWTWKDWALWVLGLIVLGIVVAAWFAWGPDNEGPKFPPDTVEGAAERKISR